MKRTVATLFLSAVMLALATSIPTQALGYGDKMDPGLTKSAVDLRLAMRQLWDDHMVYTRLFIVSSIAGIEDTGKVAERLLKDQDDLVRLTAAEMLVFARPVTLLICCALRFDCCIRQNNTIHSGRVIWYFCSMPLMSGPT